MGLIRLKFSHCVFIKYNSRKAAKKTLLNFAPSLEQLKLNKIGFIQN